MAERNDGIPGQSIMDLQIKICGITNRDDAAAAVEAGADALGFMFFAGSPRHLTFPQAAALSAVVPAQVAKVGVFVNAPVEMVSQALVQCGLTMLQFHGDETPEYCRQFNLPVMKAFRIRDALSLRPLPSYQTAYWLLDAFVPSKPGGSGASFNWSLAIEAKKLGRPIFLAGGLTPANVGEAVRMVHPDGLDVSSGVESAPGRKDSAKVRQFIAAARAAARTP